MRSFVALITLFTCFLIVGAQEPKKPRIIYAPAKLKEASGPKAKPAPAPAKKKVAAPTPVSTPAPAITPLTEPKKATPSPKALPSNSTPSGAVKTAPAPVVNVAEPPKPRVDTIVKLGGKKIGCDVKKVGADVVIYTKPNQSEQLELLRKDLEKIIYRNGRVEQLNKPIFAMVEETSWEAILVTDKPEEVVGLYKRGLVKANAGSGNPNQKAAKKSATIRLQKKAANIGGQIVLLTSSEMKGGYGESPGWDLEGIAYADTPPSDTAAVNKAIDRALNKGKKKEKK